MKKNKLVTIVLLLGFIATTHAQEFTVRIAGGYAGPGLQNSQSVLGPDVDPSQPQIDQLVNLANINDSAKTYKQVHGSYGTGGNVAVAVGYMFNKFVGIDIAVGYQHSSDISSYQVRQMSPTWPYLYATIHSFSYAVALAPSFVLTAAKTKWKVYPYGRFGIVLPVAGKLVDNLAINTPYEATYNQPGGSPVNFKASPFFLGVNTNVQLVTQATVSLGFDGAVGVAYRPLPFMSVFVEATAQYLTVRAKSSTVTMWNVDGVSALPTAAHPEGTDLTRSVYRTQINYVDQLTAQSNNAQTNSHYDPSKPKEETRPTVPGSNLGFNVGLTFFLSKKILKKDKAKEGSKN